MRSRAARLRQLATVLRPSPAFWIGEARGGTRSYELPSGQHVVVRHGTRDLEIIAEVLLAPHAYEPPPTLTSRLAGPLRIVDLGANIGTFGAFALGRWDVRSMLSFEPDPANAAILRRTIALNHAERCWVARQEAVSNTSGAMSFVPGRFAESRRAEPGEPGIEVRTIDLFGLEHDIDLLKIDIEGGEWAILSDPRMSDLRATVIVMEWHWRSAPHDDPHAAATQLITRAGYELHAGRVDHRTGIGLLWACRP
jgi:FkbM family methyltransferase